MSQIKELFARTSVETLSTTILVVKHIKLARTPWTMSFSETMCASKDTFLTATSIARSIAIMLGDQRQTDKDLPIPQMDVTGIQETQILLAPME